MLISFQILNKQDNSVVNLNIHSSWIFPNYYMLLFNYEYLLLFNDISIR